VLPACDNTRLDLFWLKDNILLDLDNLLEQAKLAKEIAEKWMLSRCVSTAPFIHGISTPQPPLLQPVNQGVTGNSQVTCRSTLIPLMLLQSPQNQIIDPGF
jgi:hypothetical protein